MEAFSTKSLKNQLTRYLIFIENRRIKIIYSDILEEELDLAPEHVKLKATKTLLKAAYIKAITEEMVDLARMYMQVGTLTEKSFNDALHIAIATIAGTSAVISWNFKHMANFIRIQPYNAINLQAGYRMINIHSPMEIIEN